MRTAPPRDVVQPESFAFSDENRAAADAIIARYPAGRQASAVIPLLDLAQRQSGGWLPRAAMDFVAGVLGMAPIRVYEVASFYTMFRLAPIGRHHVEVCTTTPCWLRGSDTVVETCRAALGIDFGEMTPDGAFSLAEVECLGACVNAPLVKIGDDFFEDLDATNTRGLIETLRRGEQPAPGSQTGRQTSAPAKGRKALLDAGGGKE